MHLKLPFSLLEHPVTVIHRFGLCGISLHRNVQWELIFVPLFTLYSLKGSWTSQERRGTLESTMSTVRSRAMNQTLTTWRVWRLKRKLTRSDGCHSRTLHISSSPPMVRCQWHGACTDRVTQLRIKFLPYQLWKCVDFDTATHYRFPALCQSDAVFYHLDWRG